jgi:c-di-GMP-binding flagellar brake protein YcgR
MSTTSQPATSRRRFLRVKAEPGLPIRVDINGDGFIDVVQAKDISEGGMRIKVSHRFSGCHIDDEVSFIIHLPPPFNRNISLEGRIRHVHDDSFGVLFSNLTDRSRALLRRYIAHRVRSSSVWQYLQYVLKMIH